MRENKSAPQVKNFGVLSRQKREKVIFLGDFGSQNMDKNKKTERQIPGKVDKNKRSWKIGRLPTLNWGRAPKG